MRFKKIIYIRYIPLTAKIYKDFYMQEALQAGIEVEYWDITILFFKSVFGQEDSSYLTNTHKFASYKELEQAILLEQPLTKTLFISIMTFEGRVGKLYRLFTKYDCTLAVFGRNMFPLPSANNSPFIKRISRLNLLKLINYFQTKNVIRQKLAGKIKGYDILFLGGELGWKGVGCIDYSEVNSAELVRVNSDDYDRCANYEDVKPLLKGDYILFLDEYLPLHPDVKLLGLKNIEPEQYYPDLCRYFEKVENQFGLPIVIAAHPKALKYKEDDYFVGRKVYFGKSSELTKYAYFVIAHDSTSINYAVIFGKRIQFISSVNIEKEINYVHLNVINLANFLGCNFQWFDKDELTNVVEVLPEENYRNYKYKFLTSKLTKNKISKDIFIDFVTNDK